MQITSDSKELVKAIILRAQGAVQRLFDLSGSLIAEASDNKNNSSSIIDLKDCKNVLQLAIKDLEESLFTVTVGDSQLQHVHNRN